MTQTVPQTPVPVTAAIEAAADRLFALQRADGSWQDNLPSAAISTATSVVALHYADPDGSAAQILAGLRWLADNQNSDGGWGDGPGCPATLVGTSFAVAALQLLAPDEAAADIAQGLAWIESQGGMTAVADPERCALHVLCLQFLALAGLYDERSIKRMPAGVALLPRKLRQKVSFVVPVTLSWSVMQRHTWPLKGLVKQVFKLAEPRAVAYFDELVEFSGPDGGIQESPLLVSMMCFALARAGVRRDLVDQLARYLRLTVREDGSWAINRDLEFSVTTMITMGLQETGYSGDGRLERTLAWIRGCQHDRAFPATGCGPGGWAWSVDSGWPNCDDTADALMALAGFGVRGDDSQGEDGVAWLLNMQNRDGSWSCFCKNNHVALDAPCAVMSSHVVDALHRCGGLTAADKPIAKAVRWFAKAQKPDGSLPCLWYRGLTAGTASALDVLGALGLREGDTARRARAWLLAQQNPDGGWGDGEGAESSAEETAWALMGLLSTAEEPGEPAVRAGARWLVEHQQPDGLWEPTLLGVYFLDLWYHDDLLAAGYAMQALGRYRREVEAVPDPGPGADRAAAAT